MSEIYIVVDGNYAVRSFMYAFSTRELAEGFREYLKKERVAGDYINIIKLKINDAVLKEEDL